MNRKQIQVAAELLRTDACALNPDRIQADIFSDLLAAFQVAQYRHWRRAADPSPGESNLLALMRRPEIRELFDEPDALGQLYQALNAPLLERAFRATARDRRKFADDEIAAVTQLFTPAWVVEFLVQNTLGRLWAEMHPDSRLLPKLRRLIPTSKRIPIQPVASIRVLDPACGTMNFGLATFELLAEMHREERDRAGETNWPRQEPVAEADIPFAIVRNNLFGIDIDPLALRAARAVISLKAGVDFSPGDWNLHEADSLLDPSIAEKMDGVFDVVVTNPPYLSARNLPAERVAKLKKRFPSGWRDLYACFIERSREFLRPGGRAGLLVMHSFMFTGSYQRLRKNIAAQSEVETIAHFGPGLFGIGNPGTLQTVAFVAQKKEEILKVASAPGDSLLAFRLVDLAEDEKEDALAEEIIAVRAAPDAIHISPRVFRLSQAALSELPRQSWAYWADPAMRRAFKVMPRLRDIAPPRQGLATTDNFRFVRFWWEVEPSHPQAPNRATPGRWFPYAKGGQFRRWYEAPRHRVNWEDDGREIKQAIIDRYPYLKGEWKWVAKNTSYYGRPGVCWSYLTSGQFSARRLEEGSIFDVAGSSCFPASVPSMLAVLNSSAAGRLLSAINPTVNFQVGDLAELPVPAEVSPHIVALAERAVELQRELDAFDETTPDFAAPMPWSEAEGSCMRSKHLASIESQIDAEICDLYGFAPAINGARLALVIKPEELARRWGSYAVGLLLGRFGGESPGRVLQLRPVDPKLVAEMRDVLRGKAGEKAAAEIESALLGIDRFLATDFYPFHVRMYQRRPPYWALGAVDRLFLLFHDSATAATVAPIARLSHVEMPPDWKLNSDNGIALNLSPLHALVIDPTMQKLVRGAAKDAEEGRYAWSE